MTPLSVSFFSSGMETFPPDIPIIKQYLDDKHPEMQFRYFTGNEKKINYMQGMGIHIAKENFCRSAVHTLCVDTSLPEKWAEPSGAKILLALPFGARFQEALSPRLLNPSLFEGFSHVLLPSPFIKELFEQMHGKLKSQEWRCAITPFSWDICQEERQSQIREELNPFFPGMATKKICAIITREDSRNPESTLFRNFDLKKVLKNLGENWFLITNNEHILEKAKTLPGRYLFSFGYLNRLRNSEALLYIADMVITNAPRIAGYYAARRKPLYAMRYKNTYFEQYMEKHFPECFLKSPEELAERPLGQVGDEDARRRLNEFLSYDAETNPCKIIDDWILEKEKERIRPS